ncbi:MAG: hypothetical protein ACYTGV_11860 [Planctomycetota bacterium]|jgi:hypothetical protein
MRCSYPLPCALVLLASLPACFDPEPERFANLAELTSLQEKKGYVLIEHFGDAWPAEVVTQHQYRDSVNVILTNSEAYRFDEFDGYRLRVIKLSGTHNDEIVVVFRSQEKR